MKQEGAPCCNGFSSGCFGLIDSGEEQTKVSKQTKMLTIISAPAGGAALPSGVVGGIPFQKVTRLQKHTEVLTQLRIIASEKKCGVWRVRKEAPGSQVGLNFTTVKSWWITWSYHCRTENDSTYCIHTRPNQTPSWAQGYKKIPATWERLLRPVFSIRLCYHVLLLSLPTGSHGSASIFLSLSFGVCFA